MYRKKNGGRRHRQSGFFKAHWKSLHIPFKKCETVPERQLWRCHFLLGFQPKKMFKFPLRRCWNAGSNEHMALFSLLEMLIRTLLYFVFTKWHITSAYIAIFVDLPTNFFGCFIMGLYIASPLGADGICQSLNYFWSIRKAKFVMVHSAIIMERALSTVFQLLTKRMGLLLEKRRI